MGKFPFVSNCFIACEHFYYQISVVKAHRLHCHFCAPNQYIYWSRGDYVLFLENCFVSSAIIVCFCVVLKVDGNVFTWVNTYQQKILTFNIIILSNFKLTFTSILQKVSLYRKVLFFIKSSALSICKLMQLTVQITQAH